MKKLYLNIVSKNIRLLLWVVALFTTVSMSAQNAEVVKTFTQRTSPFAPAQYKKDAQGKIYNLRGDFTMLGNSNLTMSPYSNTAGNNSNMVYVDIDGDGTTVNSSSAVLNLPDDQCTEIVYAGLYWSGRVHDTNTSGNTITVTKNVSTGAITETQTFDHSNSSSTAYRLDDTDVEIERIGGSGNRHSLQTVTIGNIIVEFTLHNDGTVSVRQSVGANNWNTAVTLAATVNDALVTETFNPSNTSSSGWNLVGSSSFSNGICTRNYSRTQTVTRAGRRVYELATPYIVTYNGVDYAIEKLARYIEATGSRTQQAQKTRTATSLNNCTNFTDNSWNATDYTITNLGTVSNYTYGGTSGNFTGSTNNYVTIEGPKTTTSTTSGTWTLDKRVIKFKKQDKSYETFTAANTDIYYPSGSHGNMYAAYKDVTEYVREHGAGNYFAADLATAEGNGGTTGYYGGWGLIVVYANPNMKWRDVTIFDGYAYVPGSTTASENLIISGFESAQDGLVNVTFGFMAGEGDVSIPNDYLKVLKAGGDINSDYTSTTNNDWINLGNTGNTGGAFYSNINTGGNTRNPSRQNNASFDLQKFDLPNQQGGENVIIGNSQTSTVFKYGSDQDTFIIYNMVFAVDAYVPAVEGLNQVLTTQTTADINNLQPGDEVTYTLDVFNYGSDYIDNGKIDVDVPYAMKLVSYNMVTNTQAASGANDPYAFSQPEWINPATSTGTTVQPAASEGGILRWTLGTIPTQVVVTNFADRVPMATLTYTLKVTDNCLLLQTSKDDCAVKPTINGTITGIGRNSGEKFSTEFIKGYDEDCNNTPIPGGINMKINPSPEFLTDCSLKNPIQGETRVFRKFCADLLNVIPRSEIAAAYIAGTKFYSNLPSDPSPQEVTGDFPVNPNGTQTMYYAVLPGTNQACFYQLVTQLDVITVEPTVTNVAICDGEVLQLNNTASTGYTLYYFQNEADTSALATAPNPTQPGTYTYWAANGVAQGTGTAMQYCFGDKKAFTITINSLPTAATVTDVQLCTYADYTSAITDGGNTIVWEYLDGSNWVALGTQLTGVSVVANQLKIAKAPSALNGTTFRVKSTNSTNCTSYSESMNLTVKGCNMPVNPMIHTPLNR